MYCYRLIVLFFMTNITRQNKGNMISIKLIFFNEIVIDYSDEDLDRIYREWEENGDQEEVLTSPSESLAEKVAGPTEECDETKGH